MTNKNKGATGSRLDRLGEMFGVIRNEGDSDESYRRAIYDSNLNDVKARQQEEHEKFLIETAPEKMLDNLTISTSGPRLDRLGEGLGVIRNEGDSDESYRRAIFDRKVRK